MKPFQFEDACDNVIYGLSLAESAVRGAASIAEDSAVKVEELNPIIALLSELGQEMSRIQEATGGVILKDRQAPRQLSRRNRNGGSDNGAATAKDERRDSIAIAR